jgi:hypothetical protein
MIGVAGDFALLEMGHKFLHSSGAVWRTAREADSMGAASAADEEDAGTSATDERKAGAAKPICCTASRHHEMS